VEEPGGAGRGGVADGCGVEYFLLLIHLRWGGRSLFARNGFLLCCHAPPAVGGGAGAYWGSCFPTHSAESAEWMGHGSFAEWFTEAGRYVRVSRTKEKKSMSLDLRIPMGMMFTLVGAILVAFGIATNGSAIYKASLGINANLWWGFVLLIFGLTMLMLGRRSQKRLANLPPEPIDEGRSRLGH
jgi:hypothetical protein